MIIQKILEKEKERDKQINAQIKEREGLEGAESERQEDGGGGGVGERERRWRRLRQISCEIQAFVGKHDSRHITKTQLRYCLPQFYFRHSVRVITSCW